MECFLGAVCFPRNVSLPLPTTLVVGIVILVLQMKKQAQRGSVAYLRSHSQEAAELEFEPKLFRCAGPALLPALFFSSVSLLPPCLRCLAVTRTPRRGPGPGSSSLVNKCLACDWK